MSELSTLNSKELLSLIGYNPRRRAFMRVIMCYR